MIICEHCGARVYGNVCEYCDMPIKNQQQKPASPKVKYKPAKPKIKLNLKKTKIKSSLPIIKHKKKFVRTVLAGAMTVFALNVIGTAIAVNRNITRTYIHSPSEYAVDYNDNGYIEYDDNNYIEYNDDSYSIEEFGDFEYNHHFDHHHYNYDYGYDYDYGLNDTIEEVNPIDEMIPFYDEDLPVYDEKETFRENGVFPSGTYQIGVDIPEGMYIFIPDMSDGHGVEGVYADPDYENQISSAYVHFDGTRIAMISGNGYLDFSWCTAYNLDMHPEIVNDPHKTDGMFIVGRDIPAGTYRVIGYGEYEDMAEWYVYSSINAVGSIIKESGILEDYDNHYDKYYSTITLKDGEYFELRHCIIGNFN